MHRYIKKLFNTCWLNSQGKISGFRNFKAKLSKEKYEKIKTNIIKQIYKHTNFLEKEAVFDLNFRIALLYNDISKESYCCPVCSKPRKRQKYSLNFLKTCGNKDTEHMKFFKNKREKTNLKKYGVTNPGGLPEIQRKIKQTNLEKYGVENPSQAVSIKKKKKVIYYKKYGTDHPWKLPEIRAKIKKTNIERYGKENPLASKEIQEKIKRTNLKKYGDTSWMRSADYKNKYLEKRFKHLNYKAINNLKNEPNIIHENGYLNMNFLRQITGYNSTSDSGIYQKLKEQGIKYKVKRGKSEPEYQIIDLLELAVPEIEIVHGSRQIIKPLELDIYLPEYRLAIEFNGSLYHSAGKDNWSAVNNTLEEMQNKHSTKTKACQDKGIELIHIPEWWWNYDREYWERLVLSKIGVGELQKSSELSSSYELLGSNHPVILPELYSPLEWTQETLEQLIEEGKRVYFH